MELQLERLRHLGRRRWWSGSRTRYRSARVGGACGATCALAAGGWSGMRAGLGADGAGSTAGAAAAGRCGAGISGTSNADALSGKFASPLNARVAVVSAASRLAPALSASSRCARCAAPRPARALGATGHLNRGPGIPVAAPRVPRRRRGRLLGTRSGSEDSALDASSVQAGSAACCARCSGECDSASPPSSVFANALRATCDVFSSCGCAPGAGSPSLSVWPQAPG